MEYFVNFDANKDFSEVHISDLLRSKETLDISLAYEDVKEKKFQELREIYFGDQEGYFYDGLTKEEKSQISKATYKFPKGESWLNVKYRACKYLNQNQRKNLHLPILSFTHGGFISSLLSAKGHKRIPQPGSVVVINYKNYFDENDKKWKDFSNLLNEFSKKIDYKNEDFDEVFFNKYNSLFEEYLIEQILEVEGTYEAPDLSEELL